MEYKEQEAEVELEENFKGESYNDEAFDTRRDNDGE